MGYGFTSAVTVFLAFRVHIDLIRVLEIKGNLEQSVAKYYEQYFTQAMMPTIDGSLVNEINTRRALADQLAKQYTPGQKGRIDKGFLYKDNERNECSSSRIRILEPDGHGADRSRIPHCQKVWDWWELFPGYEITGSIESGFDGRAVDNGECNANHSRPDGEYGIGREYVRRSILPDYQKASQKYQELISQLAFLQEAVTACDNFQRVSHGIASINS
jgi:hypothetical protein